MQPHSAAPLEEIEDDISEPDIDSFAGQLQQAKTYQAKGEYDDSDDESDLGDAVPVPEHEDDGDGPDADFIE